MPRLQQFAFVTACLMWFSAAHGTDLLPPQQQAQPNQQQQTGPVVQRNERGEPQLEAVQQATALLGKPVRTADGQVAGTTDDLLLDLNEGRVALVIAKTDRTGSQNLLAFPPAVLSYDPTTREVTAKVTAHQAQSAPAWNKTEKPDAAQLAAIYQHFNQTPYEREKAGTEPAAEGPHGFATLTAVNGVTVNNARGDTLGTVKDLAVALDQGLIAYVAMACSCFDDAGGKLFPVPLTAFVVKPEEKAWILELPLEVLANTPTFSEQNWPEKIERGWVEYVHVRYGRSPFGGASRQLRIERR
jgi:sporulation protein YlmC with PRC-barrel domain